MIRMMMTMMCVCMCKHMKNMCKESHPTARAQMGRRLSSSTACWLYGSWCSLDLDASQPQRQWHIQVHIWMSETRETEGRRPTFKPTQPMRQKVQSSTSLLYASFWLIRCWPPILKRVIYIFQSTNPDSVLYCRYLEMALEQLSELSEQPIHS